MSNIDIESPGADEAALKAALGALGMPVLLASGTVSSPVSFIDLTLPSGYDAFRIEIHNLNWGAGLSPPLVQSLGAVLSTDGGSTFISDTDNFDTYYGNGHYWSGGNIANGAFDGQDAVMLLVQEGSSDSKAGINCYIDMFPGDDASYPLFDVRASGWSTPAAVGGYGNNWLNLESWTINQNATVPFVPARADVLRIGPYGNLAVGESHTIVSAVYRLFGIKGA